MFCKFCGNELPENANFCPRCGGINDDTPNKEASVKQEPVKQAPASDIPSFFEEQTEAPFMQPATAEDPFKQEKSDMGGSILKFAILGLAFGMTMFLSLLGLIFSIVARTKLNTYIAKFGETEGTASVGKGLSIAGLIVSIVFSGFMALYILALISLV